MTTNRSKADGPAGGPSSLEAGRGPPGLALLGLALFGLVQAGCKSDGCSTCGFGNSISNGLQAVGNGVKSVGSIFHHKKGCGGAVGGDCGCGERRGIGRRHGDRPRHARHARRDDVIPAPGRSSPAPSIDSEPTRLEAIPGTSPASPTSGTGTGTSTDSTKSTTSRSTPAGTSRSGYTTSLPGTVSPRGRAPKPIRRSTPRPEGPGSRAMRFERHLGSLRKPAPGRPPERGDSQGRGLARPTNPSPPTPARPPQPPLPPRKSRRRTGARSTCRRSPRSRLTRPRASDPLRLDRPFDRGGLGPFGRGARLAQGERLSDAARPPEKLRGRSRLSWMR